MAFLLHPRLFEVPKQMAVLQNLNFCHVGSHCESKAAWEQLTGTCNHGDVDETTLLRENLDLSFYFWGKKKLNIWGSFMCMLLQPFMSLAMLSFLLTWMHMFKNIEKLRIDMRWLLNKVSFYNNFFQPLRKDGDRSKIWSIRLWRTKKTSNNVTPENKDD